MLVMLAREPSSSVSHASRTIGIDKAAVSRCVKRLESMGLIEAPPSMANKSRKKWHLTTAGGKLHDEILTVSLSQQSTLLDGFSESEVGILNDLLARMLCNLNDPE